MSLCRQQDHFLPHPFASMYPTTIRVEQRCSMREQISGGSGRFNCLLVFLSHKYRCHFSFCSAYGDDTHLSLLNQLRQTDLTYALAKTLSKAVWNLRIKRFDRSVPGLYIRVIASIVNCKSATVNCLFSVNGKGNKQIDLQSQK